MLLATRVPSPTNPPASPPAFTQVPTSIPASRRSPDPADLWNPVSNFTLTALHTDAAEAFPQWVLGRVAQDTWTLIAATADSSTPTPLGTTSPWQTSVCSTVQTTPEAVLIGDLRRRRHPVQRAAAHTWGLRAYIGAPVCAPDGTRLGSLCGWSTRPTSRAGTGAGTGSDEQRLRARVSQHARFLGATLSRELARISDERRQDWTQVASGAAYTSTQRGEQETRPKSWWASGRGGGQQDQLTQLVSLGAFQQLLIREDHRAHPVADPAAVLVLDVSGSVTSTVALRQVARTLAGITREVAGDDAVLARTGPRQFAVLAAASAPSSSSGPNGSSNPVARPLKELGTDERTSDLAHHLREQLRAALPCLRTGLGVRAGSTPLAQVWAGAQTDVVTLRRS